MKQLSAVSCQPSVVNRSDGMELPRQGANSLVPKTGIFVSVILSEAKDLLCACGANKQQVLRRLESPQDDKSKEEAFRHD